MSLSTLSLDSVQKDVVLPVKTRLEASRSTTGGYKICAKPEPLLTAEQERSLAERIGNGDREARDHLVRANLRLVPLVARGFAGRGLDPEDLVSEGCVGLITAAERFDPRFNTRFSTYACLWIKQAIRHALSNTTAMIRLPMHAVNLLSKWRRAHIALERALGREPRFDEVANAMELNEGQRRIIANALCTLHHQQADENRLDAAVSADESLATIEVAEQREVLRHRLERLDPRERSVITLRFGLEGKGPLTLKQVGRRLGFTREWVRKIEIRALMKMA